MNVLPLFFQPPLDVLKPRNEFVDAPAQGMFGVDVDEAGVVHERNEQIAELRFELYPARRIDRAMELAHLFVDFLPDILSLFPVKTRLGGLVLQPVRPQESR